jgi:hypothetical protein
MGQMCERRPAIGDRSHCATEGEDCVASRYQAPHTENIEDLVRAKVNCKKCELT